MTPSASLLHKAKDSATGSELQPNAPLRGSH
jgi:hypothetical protein